MSRALRFPRLPEGPVSLVLASGEFSWLHHALCREGVQSLQTPGISDCPSQWDFILTCKYALSPKNKCSF